MKSVIGIDYEGKSASAIAWLGRLRFATDETVLMHVTEPIPLTMASGAYGMMVEGQEIFDELEKAGESALKDAYVEAIGLKLYPQTQLCEGFTAKSLTDCADKGDADLIVVTSTVRSTLGSIFGGSVARGLAISAKQSLLVVREDLPPDGPLRAVFATDQSPYCEDCVRLLAQFAPKGLSHLTLLTVNEKSKHESLLSVMEHIDVDGLLAKASKGLEEQGQRTAEWLTENGIETDSMVVTGNIEETIHTVMHETKADLLIVGSQGHGFIDLITVGSTCLHEVIHERYPVLLLRPCHVAGEAKAMLEESCQIVAG